MKVVAMIPARYGATRFPGKLMADLGGKPVILRTYLATLKTGLFDQVYVVTDSRIIKEAIERGGGKAIMSKKEHECGTDRIAEAVEDLDVLLDQQPEGLDLNQIRRLRAGGAGDDPLCR